MPSTAPAADSVPFIFANRMNTNEWFKQTICGPAGDLLLVTVASEHTIDRITGWLDEGIVRINHFRVLTWRPDSRRLVRAFATHIDEPAERLSRNIDSAWQRWKRLEAQYDFIEVCGYSSSPTFQAVCGSDSLKIELLPFNRNAVEYGFHACGTPDNRPALFLTSAAHPSSYAFFRNSFEDQWNSALERSSEKDIHARWRSHRESMLTRLGLRPQ